MVFDHLVGLQLRSHVQELEFLGGCELKVGFLCGKPLFPRGVFKWVSTVELFRRSIQKVLKCLFLVEACCDGILFVWGGAMRLRLCVC